MRCPNLFDRMPPRAIFVSPNDDRSQCLLEGSRPFQKTAEGKRPAGPLRLPAGSPARDTERPHLNRSRREAGKTMAGFFNARKAEAESWLEREFVASACLLPEGISVEAKTNLRHLTGS